MRKTFVIILMFFIVTACSPKASLDVIPTSSDETQLISPPDTPQVEESTKEIPHPNETPMPTITPTPDYSEEIGAYKDEIVEELHNLNVYYAGLMEVLDEQLGGMNIFSGTDDLFSDSDWSPEVAIFSGLVSSSFGNIRKIDAPAALADLHANLADSAVYCEEAATSMSEAAMDQAPDEFMDAFSDFVDHVELFIEAQSALEEALIEYGFTFGESTQTLANTPVPTEEPINSPEPTITPQPTEQANPAQAEVVNSNAVEYEAWDGNFRIIGIVKNTGSVPIDFVTVEATILDSRGGVLNSDSKGAHFNMLAPGHETTFDIVFPEKPDGMDSYNLTVSFTDRPLFDYYEGIEIVSSTGEILGYGGYEIAGEVVNNGTKTVEHKVKFAAAFFDKAGDIIAVCWGFAEEDVITAGSSSIFEIRSMFYPDGEDVDSYALYVNATVNKD